MAPGSICFKIFKDRDLASLVYALKDGIADESCWERFVSPEMSHENLHGDSIPGMVNVYITMEKLTV